VADHDVYSFGVVSSSTLYSVQGAFPAADGYAEITGVQHMVGGEAANSSIVLSRLGARVKLDGNWIGDDDAGRRTRALLETFPIDTSRLPCREGYRGVHELVVAAEGTRTVFGAYGRLLAQRDWNMPVEDDVRQARVVCLDPFFGDASTRAAVIASEAGIPVVTIDCLPDEPVAALASSVVVAESFLRWKFPDRPPEAVFQEYLGSTRGLVVFTFGEREVWFGRQGASLQKTPAYPVEAVDTTCAGDSFRAGIVFGFLQRWDDARMVDFAAALAAIVCTRTPGAMHAPTLDEVLAFMQSRRRA